jgi:iron complex transport system permease protein
MLAAMLVGLSWGTADISPGRALSILFHGLGREAAASWETDVIFQLRLPRVLVAALVGAGLAVSGCCLQGLFNNPLASPDILGVSSGAALGAVIAISLGLDAMHLMFLPGAAFVGALGAALAVYFVATRHGRTPVATLLLAGVAINALLGAGVSFVVSQSMEEVEGARRIVYWLIGGLDSRHWNHVWMATGPVVVGTVLAVFLARDLNSLALGEETARSLGVSVQRFKIEVLVLAAVVTGASVAVSGVLAFVGLVVPHLVRILVGPDHRRLLPACALGGATFLILMDSISRVVARPGEIRIGILTSLVGGPFFLALLMWHRRKTETL